MNQYRWQQQKQKITQLKRLKIKTNYFYIGILCMCIVSSLIEVVNGMTCESKDSKKSILKNFIMRNNERTRIIIIHKRSYTIYYFYFE